MRTIFLSIVIMSFIIVQGFKNENSEQNSGTILGTGQMPNVVSDNSGNLHVVYGTGDSIMYSFSRDHGKSFSTSTLISVLPDLAASQMRGPQIAWSSNGLTTIACDKSGNIFSFKKTVSGKWMKTGRVNDVDTVSKEGLMALSGEGQNSFAVWLDLRDKHNKIFGARSTDGGQSWSKNIMIYTSPDFTVCECCKPSVVIKGNIVYVMFRNWLNGNRDLYLIQSNNSGKTFGTAQKLGYGSWPLNGCPMDGGGLAIIKNNGLQTVWRRKSKIYSCEPGKQEKEIGEGKNCTIESVNGKNVYAWTEMGEVMVMNPKGIKKSIGKGVLPVLEAIDNEHVLCIWDNEKQIHTAVVGL